MELAPETMPSRTGRVYLVSSFEDFDLQFQRFAPREWERFKLQTIRGYANKLSQRPLCLELLSRQVAVVGAPVTSARCLPLLNRNRVGEVCWWPVTTSGTARFRPLGVSHFALRRHFGSLMWWFGWRAFPIMT